MATALAGWAWACTWLGARRWPDGTDVFLLVWRWTWVCWVCEAAYAALADWLCVSCCAEVCCETCAPPSCEAPLWTLVCWEVEA